MEVRYRKERNTAYMILPAARECEEYALRILQENQLDGIMKLSIRRMNGENEYYFDITDARPLSRILERRTVTLDEIRQILEGLNQVTEQMEEYLMDVNHLILDPELIYLKTDSGSEKTSGETDFSRVSFCCHPAWEKDLLEQIRDLMQYFLNKMDHMDAGSVELAYELFQATRKEYFRMEELLELCQRIPEEAETAEAVDEGEDASEARSPGKKPRVLRQEHLQGDEEKTIAGTVPMNGLLIAVLVAGTLAVGLLLWFWVFGNLF